MIAATVEILEKRTSERRPSRGIGAGAELVEETQRPAVGLLEETGGRRHGARKSRQIGAHVLLVAYVAPDPVERGNGGPLLDRQWDAARTHQDHQSRGS